MNDLSFCIYCYCFLVERQVFNETLYLTRGDEIGRFWQGMGGVAVPVWCYVTNDLGIGSLRPGLAESCYD